MSGTESLDLQYRSLQTHKMEQIIGQMNSKKTGITHEYIDSLFYFKIYFCLDFNQIHIYIMLSKVVQLLVGFKKIFQQIMNKKHCI